MSSIGSSNLDPRHLSLIQASAAGNDSKVRQLIHEAAWHSQMDRDALRQSLQRVSARGNRNRELARFLIEKGADVNPRHDHEPSALFKAAEGGHEEMVKLLLKHNADTEAKDRDGRTALFKPALRGSISTVEALLAGGANANARDKEGRTVLIHLAAEGVAPERPPPQKQGAQKQAAKRQAAGKQTADGPSTAQQEAEKLAVEKQLADKQNAEKGKVKGPGRWKMDMIQLLLKNNADIEAKDDTRRTALLWAAVTGKTELVELLLSGEYAKPADVSASNNRGRTALHFAAEGNQVEVVRILLEHSADPRLESDGGT
jgi:ankyrin repeat protein